jgi:hypothetical protein
MTRPLLPTQAPRLALTRITEKPERHQSGRAKQNAHDVSRAFSELKALGASVADGERRIIIIRRNNDRCNHSCAAEKTKDDPFSVSANFAVLRSSSRRRHGGLGDRGCSDQSQSGETERELADLHIEFSNKMRASVLASPLSNDNLKFALSGRCSTSGQNSDPIVASVPAPARGVPDRA